MGKAIAFSTPSSAASGGAGGLLGAVADAAGPAAGGLVDFAPSLQKAELLLHEPPPGGDVSKPMGRKLDTIVFGFNPKDLSFTKGAKWTRTENPKAKSASAPTFGGAAPATLSFEMFLDATDDMSDKVVSVVERLMKTCVPTDESKDTPRPSPPWVVFHWGGLQGFPAIVKNINGKFTLFTPDGIPVRATCTITLEEMSGEPSGQNPTSGAKTATDLHVLVDGDTLASVAYRHYGSAAMWRAIADANGIDDPMRLPIGTALLVPALTEVGRG